MTASGKSRADTRESMRRMIPNYNKLDSFTAHLELNGFYAQQRATEEVQYESNTNLKCTKSAEQTS